ncbi:MAG: hypothetical protein QOG83_1119, partial [Alphaproteobacteria bacterium]|nr:hypothetical protein [Alphaproteobacteria bacterium]
MSYRTLDAAHIIETLRRLQRRIDERFPASGLAAVCRELVETAKTAQQRSQSIAAPNLGLRAAVCLAVAAAAAGLAYVARSINLQVGTAEIFSVF